MPTSEQSIQERRRMKLSQMNCSIISINNESTYETLPE
jgi:hypothetical protein